MTQELESRPLPAQPTKRYLQSAPCRTYTAVQIYGALQIGRSTFFDWKRRGWLPLVEVRIGRAVRYQAEPIDRFIARGGHRRRHAA